MTIIAGFSASRHGSAPINLAVQLGRATGEDVVAAAVVEGDEPPAAARIDREYQSHLAAQTRRSLAQAAAQSSDDVEVSIVVHRAGSIPRGLMELAEKYDASTVVLGSSSSGLLGRIALGSVTERLVHTAAVAVAIAPRGFCSTTTPLRRLTVAYGGAADAAQLIPTAAELALRWHVAMRVASFTVRPALMFSGAIERSAEDLVTRQWKDRTTDAVRRQLDEALENGPIPDVDVVFGSGADWPAAINEVGWEPGEILLLGSGAAGQRAHVFLGSAAAKILRHVPVPVMIVPRRQD